MTDLGLFRVYEPHELGDDGYPLVWHKGVLFGADGAWVLPADLRDRPDQHSLGVKHIVRDEADHRCVRCGHPYVVGESGSLEAARLADAVEAQRGTLPLSAEECEGVGITSVSRPRVQWSPCDERCTHGGPVRARQFSGDGDWRLLDGEVDLPRLVNDEADEVQAAWRILTVHHLNGRKHDLRWWNLAALCQRCHLTIQKKVQMERVYPFEHSDWFKPHAAGWYAYVYEGRNLTRAEATSDVGRLLGLERLV